jgi:lipoyl(octanoyl) transferase
MAAELVQNGASDRTLQVYLLGCVPLEHLLRLQRRLHFDITGDRRSSALIVCEHPATITVGRQGSRSHIHLESEELGLRGWPIRWVNRGGGCVLHLPGQFAIYPILPLDRLGCEIGDYLRLLAESVRNMLADFTVHANVRIDEHGVWAGDRMLAALGVSVCDWVTGHGAFVNVHPDLDLFRGVTTVPSAQPMTSLERERRGAVRPSLVRERLIEHFRVRFGFTRVSLFTDHAALAGAGTRVEAMRTPIAEGA